MKPDPTLKKKYALTGILAGATIVSAILLPDNIKLLSLGFTAPLCIQIYYLFRDKPTPSRAYGKNELPDISSE